MLKFQHLFAVTLFCLFIYLFGYPSICKYLKRDTIVIQTVEKTLDIPAPAITVVPHWRDNFDPFLDPNNTCWFEDVYDCIEETYTYPLNEIIKNSTAFNWTSRFELYRSLLFTLSSASRKLSSIVSEALIIVPDLFHWSYTEDGIELQDTDSMPSYYLHDPRYFTYATNPWLSPNIIFCL